MNLLFHILAAAVIGGLQPARLDTIRGLVLSPDGKPLPQATVTLEELGRRTESRPDGSFILAGVPSGRFTVGVRSQGYAPVARQITVPGDQTLRLLLQPSPFQLEPVTVTATPAVIETGASALAVSSLSQDRLRRSTTISIAHALDQLPGVRSLTTGGEIGKPVIRGLAGARVLVLDGGHRLEDYSWSDEDGPSVDARFAERVEVIRGPASLLYGSDAIGGVVNVIPADVPETTRPLSGSWEGYGASNNHEFGSALRLAGAGRSTGWRIGVVGRKSEALKTPLAELENTGFAALNGEAAVGTHGSWGKGTLRFAHYGGEFHLLEANDALNPHPETGEEEEGPVRKVADDRIQADLIRPLSTTLRLDAKGQLQRHWLAEAVEGDTSSLERGFDLLLRTASLDVVLHHQTARLAGAIGGSGWYQDNDTRGDEPLVPAARTASAGLFGFERLSAGRWAFLAGARVDARHLASDGNIALGLGADSKDDQAFSGDAGVVFQPLKSVSLTANLGRAWRAPTLFELFANGLQIGEARYDAGDRGLSPEASWNGDVSLRWQSARWRGEIAGYRNLVGRYIYLAPTGEMRDSFPVYRYQQTDAVLRGAEASVETSIGTVLVLSAQETFVEGSVRSSGEPLPAIPPLRSLLGAEVHLQPWSWTDRMVLRAEVERSDRPTRLSPFDVATTGYTLLHFSGGMDFRVGPRRFTLDLTVRNAANTQYRDFLSRYKAFALNPGRNVMVRLSTEF